MDRLSPFEFACRACDAVFGDAYVLTSVPRPSLRDRRTPMELYEDDMFFARYRFTKETVRELLAFLPIGANDDNRGLPLPPMLQLLVTLRFYGAGTFQIVAGDLVNVSQPTVCRTVKKVTRLIARHLFRAVVRFPGASQLSSVMQDFYEIYHFPGVTGCIDCTHVRIKSPGGDDAEVYRNRKGVFSVNVQFLLDNFFPGDQTSNGTTTTAKAGARLEKLVTEPGSTENPGMQPNQPPILPTNQPLVKQPQNDDGTAKPSEDEPHNGRQKKGEATRQWVSTVDLEVSQSPSTDVLNK
ncbi:hypothetical protein HPB49_017696 [Dermacentor silvarum]|uniref:Uncharacterized protein n=1 Tax=Dermacentor silvarum TaxID=543639 RepID=A0ACB8CSB2_DERSI|nr:hypothetical protein HPB49_017696 [Dermacentor silvarum]